MSSNNIQYSLVSPVYNEAERIEAFISQSHTVLCEIADSFEIVLVNDCSTDDTQSVLNRCVRKYSNLRIVHLQRNVGQHIATSIALSHSVGHSVFMMDSDLQVAPRYMKELIAFGHETPHWDIISTFRTKRSSSFSRKIGSLIVSWVLKRLTNSKLKDIGSTFKLIKRSALDDMLSADIQIQNLPILMMNMGFSIIEFPIEYNTIQKRQSHYKLKDLISALIIAILNFTTGQNTLLFLILTGVLSTLVGTISIVLIIGNGMIHQSTLPTNYLLFFLSVFMVGLIFLLMGILTFKIERINKNLLFRKSVNQKFNVVESPT